VVGRLLSASRHALTWTVLALVVGLSASLLAAATMRRWEQDDDAALLERRVALAAAAVTAELRRYEDTVTQLAASMGTHQDFRAADFQGISRPLADARLSGASGVAFIVPATDGQVRAVQSYWRGQGATITLAPIGRDREHFFPVITHTLDGAPSPTGLDLTQSWELTQALQEARRTHRVTVSDTYVLLKDRALPRAQQQNSFVMVSPIYTTPPPGAQPGFRGWVLLELRGGDLARATLTDASQNLVNVRLTARGSTGAGTDVATVRPGSPRSAGAYRLDVPVAQQRWTLSAQGQDPAGQLHGAAGRPDVTVAVAGAVISLLLALLVHTLLTTRRRALARVEAATAELSTAEAAARQQAALMSAVMDTIGDGVGVVNQRGEFVMRNRSAKALFGAERDVEVPELGPERYGVFLPDGTTPFPLVDLPLARALAGESCDLVDMVVRNPGRPEGATITVSGRPLIEVDGLPGGGAVAVFQDVTERRRLEATLQAQHDRYERMLGVLSDLGEGVTVLDSERFTYVNEAFARLVGHSVEELLALPSIDVLAADDAALDSFSRLGRDLRRQLSNGVLVTRLRHRDGHAVPVEMIGAYVEHDGAQEWFFVVRDLSERRRWERDLAERAAALERANRQLAAARDAATAASKAKSDFLAMMSHEIRTPLNGVIGLNELLLDTALTPEQRGLAASAGRSGEALLAVINDVLDFSKIEAGKLDLESTAVDVRGLLHDVAELFAGQAASAGLDLLVEVDATVVARVDSDPTRLRQILSNLVSNAVKFTGHGQVTLRATVDDGRLRLAVEDSGMGIDEQTRRRLFVPFEQADTSTTRQFGGTGLGLTISRHLAELLGGTLELDSTPGEGSIFTLVLPAPRRDVDGTGDSATTAGAAAPLTGRRVLLACATTPLREHLHGVLQRWGASVVAPTDASWPLPEPGQIDIAVIDAREPLSPYRDRLIGLGARCPLLLLTHPGQAVTDRPLGAGDVTVPVRAERLLDALRATLGDEGAQTFPVPVPRAADSVRPPAPPSTDEVASIDPATTSPLRVLVAEDNLVNQRVTKAMLTKLGHVVDIVASGREAVEAAQLVRYDLILMDCQMPDMDGYEATRVLRGLPGRRQPPIIALTASVTTDVREACLAAGMDAYLSKPVRLEALRQAVIDAVSRAVEPSP
jgi:PAS domain S-box-containing protein